MHLTKTKKPTVISVKKNILLTWLVGVFIFFSGYLMSLSTDQNGKSQSLCEYQLQCRDNNLRAEINNLIDSFQRKAIFETALLNGSSPVFNDARKNIEYEENEIKKSIQKIHSLEIETPGELELWRVCLMLIPIALTILIAFIIKNDFSFDIGDTWFSSGLVIFAFLVLTNILQNCITSIYLTTNKIWFDWSSFCVSPMAFFFNQVSLIGAWICISLPLAVFYAITDKRFIPTVDIHSKHGDCDVGEYINKSSRWVVIGSLVILIIEIFWAKNLLSISGKNMAYLISPLATIIVLFVLIYRMVLNAFSIRRDYVSKRASLGNSWSEIAAKQIPQDPTITFIDSDFWKLPTAMYPVLTSAWVLADILGLSSSLLEGFK